ncbi:chloride channel [Polychytrium aggregatum]|uniref:chloride channel n=1 Tax=Polychytrium aggregatum TaxID=110093 RepID=UPI0022FEBBF3|nr:chloride channel [Polychytrium aggregatum]KAI9202265.1 chloride channel [Polychytrium aggregatum]
MMFAIVALVGVLRLRKQSRGCSLVKGAGPKNSERKGVSMATDAAGSPGHSLSPHRLLSTARLPHIRTGSTDPAAMAQRVPTSDLIFSLDDGLGPNSAAVWAVDSQPGPSSSQQMEPASGLGFPPSTSNDQLDFGNPLHPAQHVQDTAADSDIGLLQPSFKRKSRLEAPGGHSISQASHGHRTQPEDGNSVHNPFAAAGSLLSEENRALLLGSKDLEEYEWDEYNGSRRVAYTDFTTIDWIHDLNKERRRMKQLHGLRSLRGKLHLAWDRAQGWIIVFLVGITTGWLAGLIDVCTGWLNDIKEGYCTAGFYLNRKFCCWHIGENAVCDEWLTWNAAARSQSSFGGWMAGCILFIAWAALFAGVCSVLVKTYAPYAAGSGIPEVKTILGGFVIKQFLGLRTLAIKCIGLPLSVGSGLSLGVEGPLVHISCCLGHIFSRLFNTYAENGAKQREVLSAAVAAGISVSFGTPIGGVLFSLEEISSYFPYQTMWRSFFCAMVAAISLQLMNPFRTGKLVPFQVTYNRDWHGFELIFFAILGILGGIFGALFIKINLRFEAIRRNSVLTSWPIAEVTLMSLITSVVCYAHIYLRVNTVEFLSNLFRECKEVDSDFHGLCIESFTGSTVILLLVAAAIKIALTIVTFGMKVPGGILVPTMAIGACVGRALGIIVQSMQRSYPDLFFFAECSSSSECVTPGIYAVIGAAAALSGVTRMTVSLTVIMFELTGALSFVLPIMITIMISKWVANAYDKEGIYDGLIRLYGYPFLDSREEYKLGTVVTEVMAPVEELETISANGETIEGLDHLLQSTDFKGYPIVNSKQELVLVGFVGRAELRFALDRARNKPGVTNDTICCFSESWPYTDCPEFLDMRPWIDQTPMSVPPQFPIELVVELFKKMGLRYLVVTKHGRLHGFLTKKDVIRHVAIMNHPNMAPTADS